MTKSRYSRVFGYEGVCIRVCGSDPSDLAWIEEFLTPQFHVTSTSEWDHEVTYVADTQRYNELLAQGASGADVNCFTLDNSVIRLPLWRSPSTQQIIFDERFGSFYLLHGGTQRITVLHGPAKQPARTALMRVVRELAMNHSWCHGGVFIHAAAFAINHCGVLIAGPKRAGKTTLLMHVLRQPTTRYLSNDRVFVKFRTMGSVARGMPTIVSIRHPTIERLPALREYLGRHGHIFHQLRREVSMASMQAPLRERQSYSLSPAQFCGLLDTEQIGSAQVAALVFPRVTHEPGSIVLKPIAADVGAQSLRASLFSAPNGDRSANVFMPNTSACHRTLGELASWCRQLTSQVLCYRCDLGTDAYDREEGVHTFIRQVMS